MLDWFAGKVGYDASELVFGKVLILDPSGEVLRESNTWETAVGSHNSSIQVSSTHATPAMEKAAKDHGYHLPQGPILRIGGNPSKYLQGHNLFGPPVSDLGPVLQDLVRALPDGLRPFDADATALPAVHRSVLDVNSMIRLDSHEQVHQWIRGAITSTRSQHGRAIASGATTAYWGKNSKRWVMKAYCKHCELVANKKRFHLDDQAFSELLAHSDGMLRLELRLKRLELADRGTLTESILWEFWDRITIGVPENMTAESLPDALKPSQRKTLKLWYSGFDPRFDLSKNTFYTHRRAILKAGGPDISLTPSDVDKRLVREMFTREYLEPRAVSKVPAHLEKYLHKTG